MAQLSAVIASTWSTTGHAPEEFLPHWHQAQDPDPADTDGSGGQTPEQMLAIAKQISGVG